MIRRVLRGHRGRCLGALTGLLLVAGGGRAGAAQPFLRLADDRGRAIDSPLEVCFQLETRSDCTQAAPAATVRVPQVFHGLRIEGADHGPLELRRQDMTAQSDGSYRVTVARKALLSVERPARELAAAGPAPAGGQQALTVSLYSPGDPSFREPALRATLEGAAWRMKIPAGEFVASLKQAADAPLLQRLSAPPGAKVRLAYRRLQGWSLVVRCRAAGAGR